MTVCYIDEWQLLLAQQSIGVKCKMEMICSFFYPCFSQVAVKTLPFYNDYFNVPYPLPKIDLIAIADFAAGKYNSYDSISIIILW